MERRMSRLPLVLLLAALASPAKAQVVDGVPIGPRHPALTRRDTVRQLVMTTVSRPLNCPMPVVHGAPSDSMPVTMPMLPKVPADKPVPMPTARGKCRNTLDTRR
jgi:hypothetical protein